MILLIDNYDSFSYNLYQMLGTISPEIKVIRNDAMTVDEIAALHPSHIILSPGPGRPEDAGIIIETVQRLGGKIPILGVCLGHQAICAAYGAVIVHAKQLMHGKQSVVTLDTQSRMFRGLPAQTAVARYHSLAADAQTVPDCLRVTAKTDDGEIMAVQHAEYPVYGLQFHPESILTPEGIRMLRNFLLDTPDTADKPEPVTEPKNQKPAEQVTENRAEEEPKMIADAIKKIVDKKDLTYAEAYAVMNEIMNGETTPTQNAAFLAALSTKSTKAETIDEITGCAAAMREHALHVEHDFDVLEIVGTGGDHSHSFNISTTSLFVLAAGGVKVSKHGNRAASSWSGTADCLEALGINIHQDPETCRRLLEEVGMCFMFAQQYHNSMKYLQVDYIDYYLLHAIGGGGMENLHQRFLDNGMLDYLMAERDAGRIRNLGFSYHGDIEVFDYLLSEHDKYKWDFVQIELNYLDWDFANEINNSNTDARYLYAELQKRGIPAVVMEPLLGGRLANIPQFLVNRLKQRDPEKSVASWAFRYAGTPEGVLTVLSGMTYMEHLKDNLLSYCPLQPVTKEDEEFLYDIAKELVGMNNIPCNDCKYCMPCPYGIDIPALFVHYNKCKNEGRLPVENMAEEYRKRRREYLIGLDRAVPKLRQADHCIGCGQCEPHCPQKIRIPRELHKLAEFVEQLRRNPDAMPDPETDTETT